MSFRYKKVRYAPNPDGSQGDVRTDVIGKDILDESDVVINHMFIPVDNTNLDYQEYLEWEAIDGNTIAEAD